MLESIFLKNGPLHDGAAIISKGRIRATRCILPITDRENFPNHLGTRHRAAVGITESTDAFAIIVSEQTGEISIATGGQLEFNLTKMDLIKKRQKQIKKIMLYIL